MTDQKLGRMVGAWIGAGNERVQAGESVNEPEPEEKVEGAVHRDRRRSPAFMRERINNVVGADGGVMGGNEFEYAPALGGKPSPALPAHGIGRREAAVDAKLVIVHRIGQCGRRRGY